jgi:lysozyme family protein
MADFITVHKMTSPLEGGYSCDPNDVGNWTGAHLGEGILVGTKYGIACHTYAHYLGYMPSKIETMTQL